MQKQASKPKKRLNKEAIVSSVINHYIAQATGDPTALKPGQTITDPTGKSMTVVENDSTTTNVVMAPTDQMAGQSTPVEGQPIDTTNVQDLEVVENTEMVNYTYDAAVVEDPSAPDSTTNPASNPDPYSGAY